MIAGEGRLRPVLLADNTITSYNEEDINQVKV